MTDLPNVKISDDRFNILEHVDMLLGANIFYEHLRQDTKCATKRMIFIRPIAKKYCYI